MKLPNADLAVVDQGKITNYLLNAAHPDNGGKAKFFLGLGFTAEEWQIFAGALERLANRFPRHRARRVRAWRQVYCRCRIETPLGGRPSVRTVWIIDKGNDKPRLVTAYPG